MGFERQLINQVRERKCLYQTKSRSNTNNQQRLNEWHRVSAVLRKSVMECRQRWRSLRDRFVREKKKLESGDISPDSEQLWEYYNELKFLIPSVKPRRNKKERIPEDDAKIYLNRELSDNFVNIRNSQDEGPSTYVYESCSLDEMLDTETTSLQNFNDDSKPNDATEELLISDEDDIYEDQKFSNKQNAPIAFQNIKEEDWIEDDFDNYPIIKIPITSNADVSRNSFLKNVGNMTSLNFNQTETVTTTTNVPDPAGCFVDLVNSIKTEISKVLAEEKDENDLFLECMAKKMKRLSPRAKFRIQAKLLENITEELLKEIPE